LVLSLGLEHRQDPDQEVVRVESSDAHLLPGLKFLEAKKEEEGDLWWMQGSGDLLEIRGQRLLAVVETLQPLLSC